MSRLDLIILLTLRLVASAGFLLIAWEVLSILSPERMPLQ